MSNTSLPIFTESTACKTGENCGYCRAQEMGRNWRANLVAHYTMPSDMPDFVCPYGKPWTPEAELWHGFQMPDIPTTEAARPRPIMTKPARATKPCSNCSRANKAKSASS